MLRFGVNILLCGLVLFLFSGICLGAGDDAKELSQTKQGLEDIKKSIEETARLLGEKKNSEEILAKEVQKVQRDLEKLSRQGKTMERLLEENELRTQEKQKELDLLRRQLGQKETQVRRRLVALYKTGDTGLVKIIFSARSPETLEEDVRFFELILQQDRELLGDYRSRIQATERAAQELTSLQEKQQVLRAENKKSLAVVAQARKVKDQLLGQVRSEQKDLGSRLAELKDRAARLSGLLKKLETRKSTEYTGKGGVFSKQKGRLPWPVEGPVKVGFGTGRHPELGTLQESHGIEIGVAAETPVKAIWDGRVVFSNSFKGYGNLMIIDHGDNYYSLYAQASRLLKTVGTKVLKGEPVAYSGYNGSQTVYFEIRSSGKPVNPLDWIMKR